MPGGRFIFGLVTSFTVTRHSDLGGVGNPETFFLNLVYPVLATMSARELLVPQTGVVKTSEIQKGFKQLQDTLGINDKEFLTNLNITKDVQVGNEQDPAEFSVYGSIRLGDFMSITSADGLEIDRDVTIGSDSGSPRSLVLHGTADIKGRTILEDELEVLGQTFMRSKATIGTAEAAADLEVHGDATVRQKLIVDGDGEFASVLQVSGEAHLDDKLRLGGESDKLELSKHVEGEGAEKEIFLEINESLKVQGNADVAQTLSATELDLRGHLNVFDGLLETSGAENEGQVHVRGPFTVQPGGASGDAAVKVTYDAGVNQILLGDAEGSQLHQLRVDADAVFNNATEFMDSIEVGGPATFLDNVQVGTTADPRPIEVTGNADIGANLNLTGDATFGGVLNFTDTDGTVVVGKDNTNALVVQNDVRVGEPGSTKDLHVTKDAMVAGKIVVTGEAHLDDKIRLGGETETLELSKTVDAGTGEVSLKVSDSLHVGSNALVDGTLTVGGNSDLGGTLAVDGATTLKSTLNVESDATIEANAAVQGNMSVTGTSSLTDDVMMGSKLTVAGETILQDALDVEGATLLESTADIWGATTIGRDIAPSSLQVYGGANISEVLEVSGQARFDDQIRLGGPSDVLMLSKEVAGSDVFLQVSEGLKVLGGEAHIGTPSVSQNLIVYGTTDLKGALTVESPTQLNDTLGVGEDASFAKKIIVTGDAHLDDKIRLGGDHAGATLELSRLGDGDMFVSQGLRVAGKLVVDGDVTTLNTATLEVEDNKIVINKNFSGSLVDMPTLSGIEVNRGAAASYKFVFDNPSESFKIGMEGELQKVATREDAPEDSGLMVWNDTAARMDTFDNLVWKQGVASEGTNPGLGINTSNPQYELHVDGEIFSTGDMISLSDQRFKSKVETIPSALEKVEKMRGVYFNWNHDLEGERKVGVIAQETEAAVPELVHTNADGVKAVAYSQMAGVFIEAIKEMAAEIRSLKAELAELKKAC